VSFAGSARRFRASVADDVVGNEEFHRHCERSEAIQGRTAELDCFVASAPRNDGVIVAAEQSANVPLKALP
jgi:hypothetical protein